MPKGEKHQLNIYMSEAMWSKIKCLADEEGRSVSNMGKRLLEKAIDDEIVSPPKKEWNGKGECPACKEWNAHKPGCTLSRTTTE